MASRESFSTERRIVLRRLQSFSPILSGADLLETVSALGFGVISLSSPALSSLLSVFSTISEVSGEECGERKVVKDIRMMEPRNRRLVPTPTTADIQGW